VSEETNEPLKDENTGETLLPLAPRSTGTPEGGNSSLHVKLAVYDGPLDLLLELIKKNEMDIYDIPVAEITRQYLESLAHMKQLDLEIAGEFIVMAATLIYIKSKMLLPQDGTGLDDEDGQDPRAELVRKLLEYQAFKEAAKELGYLEDERGHIFTRQISDYYLSELDAQDIEIDTFSANLYDLLSAFQNVMTKLGNTAIHEVYEQIITIEEKMVEIKTVLFEKRRVAFTGLFGERWTRNQLIATFLAVLEIVRSKFARIAQDEHYGEIMIERMEDANE
jgi:segregation and condensation protein A